MCQTFNIKHQCLKGQLLSISEILAAKKKKYSETARLINQTKTEIDDSRLKLDRLKEEREASGIDNVIVIWSLVDVHYENLPMQYTEIFFYCKN